MKRIFVAFSLMFSLVMTGCNNNSDPKISGEEAKSIVIQDHTKHIGKVEITSVSHEGNKYIVKWSNKENCENGTDHVDDQNGEIKNVITSIC